MAKVLVVDDDGVTRKFLQFLLRSQGFGVRAAADGIEALELLAREEVDLVITDLNMPRLDGLELIRRIRAHPAAAGIPVILLTTEGDEESRRQGVEAGASEYLVKPVSGEQLAGVVRHWTAGTAV